MDWGRVRQKNWLEAIVSKMSSISKVNLQSPKTPAQHVFDGTPKL